MPKIALHLDHPIVDGEQITFKSPCASEDTTGLKIYTPTSYEDETEIVAIYTIKDANGKTLHEKTGVFDAGAYVSVRLDTTNAIAYTQNGKYIDNVDVTLLATGWTGTAPNITQTVTATGVTPDSYPDPAIKYPASVTRADKKKIDKAAGFLTKMQTGTGTVTFTACETPAVDITIELKGV